MLQPPSAHGPQSPAHPQRPQHAPAGPPVQNLRSDGAEEKGFPLFFIAGKSRPCAGRELSRSATHSQSKNETNPFITPPRGSETGLRALSQLPGDGDMSKGRGANWLPLIAAFRFRQRQRSAERMDRNGQKKGNAFQNLLPGVFLYPEGLDHRERQAPPELGEREPKSSRGLAGARRSSPGDRGPLPGHRLTREHRVTFPPRLHFI